MDTFHRCYAAVLIPYKIDPANAAAAVGPQEVTRNIYAAAQEVVPTAFLQCHRVAGGLGAHIFLVHYVSSYVLQMIQPMYPWDGLSFASKGKSTCSAIGCTNWLTSSLN